MDIIEEIKRLKALFDEGAINEDEFNVLKKNTLSKIKNSTNTWEKSHSPPENQVSKKANNQATTEYKQKIKPNKENYSKNNNDKSASSRSGCLKYWIIGFIIVVVLYFIGVFSDDGTSGYDDVAVLRCRFCQETVYGKRGEGVTAHTIEQGGCAVVHFYSGRRNAFCSYRCCEAYRATY